MSIFPFKIKTSIILIALCVFFATKFVQATNDNKYTTILEISKCKKDITVFLLSKYLKQLEEGTITVEQFFGYCDDLEFALGIPSTMDEVQEKREKNNRANK